MAFAGGYNQSVPDYASAYPANVSPVVQYGTPQYGMPYSGPPSYASPVIHGPQEQLLVQNCGRGLNVRDQPSVTGNLLSALANGSIVVAQARSGNWVQHQTGWSLGSEGDVVFLAPLAKSQPQPATMVQQQIVGGSVFVQPQVVSMGGIGYSAGISVTTISVPMCQHEWVDSGEPSFVAWLICLTGFCCSLCLCTRTRCRKCGTYFDV